MFERIINITLALTIFGILVFVIPNAIEHDNARRDEIAELSTREAVGEIATGPNTTIRLYEFTHPKRPEMTCLWARSAPQGGLHCWRDD